MSRSATNVIRNIFCGVALAKIPPKTGERFPAMENKERLHEFFAATMTSIYHVTDTKDNFGVPIVKKIHCRDPRSTLKVGEKLKNGYFVAITRMGLVLYFEDPDLLEAYPSQRIQRLENVRLRYWGSKTSPVVALFLKRNDALACSEHKNLRPCDPRWREFTEEVLAAIGDRHHVFILAKFASLEIRF